MGVGWVHVWGIRGRESAVKEECCTANVTFDPRPPPIPPWEQRATADTRQCATSLSGLGSSGSERGQKPLTTQLSLRGFKYTQMFIQSVVKTEI